MTSTRPDKKIPEPALVYDVRKHSLRETRHIEGGLAEEPTTDASQVHHRAIKLKLLGSMVLAVAIVASYIGVRLYKLSKIFVPSTNAAAHVQLTAKPSPITASHEGDGRINILFLGIGDPSHAGADLSDSMMVMSVDTRTHDVGMLSIPRDLWVDIPGLGYNKINDANAFGDSRTKDGGPALAMQVVSKTLGIPVQYFVRTDFTGLKEAVDTLGGVTVTVPQALYDSEYPCQNNEKYSCGLNIKAGTYVMNGTLALEYARCRKGYCGNDFGRARRQQDILLDMKDKALSLPTLVNPAKISSLIDILGDNVRTDLSLDELKDFYNMLKGVSTSNVSQNVLDNTDNDLVVTANIGGASTVIPTAGVGNYGPIQAFVRSIFFDGEIKREVAALSVENDSGSPATGTAVCALLKSYSYNVVSCTNGATTQSTTTLTDLTGGKKPYTLQYLQKRFNLKAQSQPAVSGASDPTAPVLRLVIGENYRPKP